MRTHTRTVTSTHVTVSFANPYLVCDHCQQPVTEWHNPEVCGCQLEGWENAPCGHRAGITSTCFSWGPVDGCSCADPAGHRLLQGAGR
jgi:hypothetical protein